MTAAALVFLIALCVHARLRQRAAERSLELLRAVVEETTDAVFVKDAAGKYLLLNPAGARLVGRPIAEVLGRDDTSLFEPGSARLVQEKDRAMLESGLATVTEEVLTAAGVTRSYQVSKVPLRDGDGRVVGVIGIARDVTERKRLADFVRDMGEAWFTLDQDWRFTSANDRCHTLLHHTRDAMIGHRIWDVFSSLVGTPMEGHYRRAMRDRVPVAFEACSPVAKRWLDIRLFPTGDGLAAFLLDIEDRKRAQMALEESEERYRRLVDVLPSALVLCLDGRVSYCNPAMVALCGAPDAAALIGREAASLMAPEERELIRARIETMTRTGQPSPIREGRLVRLDGAQVPVTVVAAPFALGGATAVMAVFSDLTERERSLQRLHSILESVSDAILTAGDDRTVLFASTAAARVFGRDVASLVGARVDDLLPALAGLPWPAGARELEGVRAGGTRFPAEVVVTPLAGEAGSCFTLAVRDITERRLFEEQLRHAQKMDAVGRLAGGIAHDFNNALMVVNGYADQLLEDLPAGDEQRVAVTAIRNAGERASRLTRQLLSFSQKGLVMPVDLNLADVVRDLSRALGRMLGEDVELTVAAGAVDTIRVDPGGLEQVILNLALNAREAMPTGGRLSLAVSRVEPEAARGLGLPPGSWVELVVADTGCGIPSQNISKIFEPFFTTKPFVDGKGLGLAVVHGVVQQSGGRVTVESVVDRGTTFRLYFPARAAPAARPPAASRDRGTETILVVEDDEEVRTFTRSALTARGYTVLTAGCAAEVEAVAGTKSFDLVLTDVVLPGPNGRQIAERLRALNPRLKVLYMSGYPGGALAPHGVAHQSEEFLSKPFTVAELMRRVRATLDA